MVATRKVSDITFREDLYPRIETSAITVQKYAEDLDVLPPIEINQNNELIDGWHRWTAHGLEVSFSVAFPDVCPPTLRTLVAGVVRGGVFYPSGSVATHYFHLQRQAAVTAKEVPHVYFIQSVRGGPVKIGTARDPESRLLSLQTAHPYPLRIIGLIPHGGVRTERLLHRRFADHRMNGEWFEWTPDMEEFLQ